jgi:DNA-binding SARP family transcriptional activator
MEWVQRLVARSEDAKTVVLHLFGGPFVTVNDCRIAVPEGGARLLAFVALHDNRVERRYAAGALWPIGNDLRAAGNLRSALWRLKRGCVPPLLVADKSSLSLRDDVVTDLHVISQWAYRVIEGMPTPADLDTKPEGVDALDLLPGWYDDWALMVRERIRHRLLHALEALTVALVRCGRCGDAVEVALLAVSSDPLRESAQRALIEACVAEGNWVEGRRRLEAYRSLLLRELGIEPDPLLSELLRGGGNVDHLSRRCDPVVTVASR